MKSHICVTRCDGCPLLCMIRETETIRFREEDGMISLEQVECEIPSKCEI